MQDVNDLIHIKISRVVPAERWRVIRMLTKVWEFSKYIKEIKEVTVLEKTGNVLRTKWRVLVDDLPINWIEEDSLFLNENAIKFKAVEGDLQEFYGQWNFKDHTRGTEVHLDVFLNVGIPAIRDFAQNYMKDLVAKIFLSIIDSLENRLISTKYAALKNEGGSNKIAGFGILGHFYNFNHLKKSLKMLYPDFKIPSEEFLGKLFNITPSFKIYDKPEFKSKTGETTSGCIIACTFIPDMLESDTEAVYSKVVRACKVAEKQGVGIVTLGGFTSMAGERLGRQIREDVDIPITTGNTYTAALSIDGVKKAVELIGKDIRDLKITIVGATGDIGSACARVLSRSAKKVTITGRTKSNLRALSNELKKYKGAQIDATTDNKRAVKDADVVIAAANSSSAILKFDWFKPGSIICDLAYPKNISYAATKRDDILVYSGGLASMPDVLDSGFDLGIPSTEICYGCFCEVIILALERRFESFSYGRGNITSEKMEEINRLGVKHGFVLAPFFWADRVMQNQDFERLKKY